MLTNSDYCRALIAANDKDRYRCSLFAESAVKPDLWGLYALNLEMAMVSEQVREPMLGLIRFTWWRDALAEIYAGKVPRGHVVLNCVKEMLPSLPFSLFEEMLKARELDLEPAPFATVKDVEAYLQATSGVLFRLAFRLWDEEKEDELADQLGLLWGIVGLLRARAFWRARGRSWVPQETGEREAYFSAQAKHLIGEIARKAYKGPARSQLLFADQAALYLRRLDRQGYEEKPVENPADIWRLTVAHWTGRRIKA